MELLLKWANENKHKFPPHDMNSPQVQYLTEFAAWLDEKSGEYHMHPTVSVDLTLESLSVPEVS